MTRRLLAVLFPRHLAADGRIDKGGNSPGWQAGEILMIEFPTTMRNVQVLLEETHLGSDAADPMDPDIQEKEDLGEGKIRCRVMLAAPGQNVGPAGEADPVANANYIEIKVGETATINSRQKVLFIVINKFDTDNVLASDGTVAAPVGGHQSDMASILVTGVLDHEPGANASSAANEPVSIVRDANGVDRELRQIWGAGEGIG